MLWVYFLSVCYTTSIITWQVGHNLNTLDMNGLTDRYVAPVRYRHIKYFGIAYLFWLSHEYMFPLPTFHYYLLWLPSNETAVDIAFFTVKPVTNSQSHSGEKRRTPCRRILHTRCITHAYTGKESMIKPDRNCDSFQETKNFSKMLLPKSDPR